MRYVLIGLGLITIVLAVVLAREGQWWAAIPDGFFGMGIPWVAWVSLQDEQREHQRARTLETGPPPESIETAPAAAPGSEAIAAELPPAPSVIPPLYPGPVPSRSRKRKRR